MRVGVDVGGTNTDAVLMDGKRVLASCKSSTTANISDGIVNAINHVLNESGVKASAVQTVMIGTTQFTNAFVECKGLLPVGVLRLCLPASRGLPPLADWPSKIKAAVGPHYHLVKGGYQFDGRPISELDELEVAKAARQFKAKGIKSVAICGIFSPLKSDMEERAADIVRQEIPDVCITLSSKIGRLGLLERENAAIMNASLAELSIAVVDSFRRALARLEITAPFYISQNDGTLMSAQAVEAYPVMTFASGPTNSMRGAAYLSGLDNALVADIGGTTTDLGVLVNGFPRESSVTVDIGGVRTNFRMPDVLAIGLGGGSHVSQQPPICIGPESVGFRLTQEAMVFGGNQLTTTDIAVAAGYAQIGDPTKVAGLPPALVTAATDRIHHIIEDGVDRIKTSAEPVPLILVGGGAILVDRPIAGAKEVIVPENAGVANAIGASIALVSGEADLIFSYQDQCREASVKAAKQQAIDAALAAGAIAETIEIIDFEEAPLAYLPGNTVRLRVKAAGELSLP